MSRKDYIRIAAVIKNIKSLKDRDTVAMSMADMLAEDNYRFKRDRFLEACGVR